MLIIIIILSHSLSLSIYIYKYTCIYERPDVLPAGREVREPRRMVADGILLSLLLLVHVLLLLLLLFLSLLVVILIIIIIINNSNIIISNIIISNIIISILVAITIKLFSLLSVLFQTQSGFKRFSFRELRPDCVRKRTERNEKSLIVTREYYIMLRYIFINYNIN